MGVPSQGMPLQCRRASPKQRWTRLTPAGCFSRGPRDLEAGSRTCRGLSVCVTSLSSHPFGVISKTLFCKILWLPG